MFRKLLGAEIAHTVLILTLCQHVDNAASARFLAAVDVTSDRFGLLFRLIGNFLREPEVKGVYRTCLHTEGLFVLADAIAAHGGLARFAGDVVFGDDFPGTGVDAVLATDARILVDDHRAFFIFRDRFHRTHRGAGGEIAVHAAVSRPQR